MSAVKAETLLYNQKKAQNQKESVGKAILKKNEVAAECQKHMMEVKQQRAKERRLEQKINMKQKFDVLYNNLKKQKKYLEEGKEYPKSDSEAPDSN